MKSYKNQAGLLKTNRENAGVTQKMLADKLKVDTQYISNIERGMCGIPVKHVDKICKFLKTGITPRDFFNAKIKDERASWKSILGDF